MREQGPVLPDESPASGLVTAESSSLESEDESGGPGSVELSGDASVDVTKEASSELPGLALASRTTPPSSRVLPFELHPDISVIKTSECPANRRVECT
jgi:hypothetical protein